MKRTIFISCVALFLGALLMTSCFSEEKKGTATIYDGEIQWSNWSYTFARGETSEGDLALWQVSFVTEIGNSYRTFSLTMNKSEPGTYSCVYDENSETWSSNSVSYLRLTVDYDGQPYPEWNGQLATITIHNYDKKTKAMSASIEAIVVKKGTSDTRNVKVEMENLHLVEK